MSAKVKPNELNLIRTYDAPVKDVWDAWTDPKKAAKWWGPRGFTITTHSKDLRPGGTWNYTMHGPDGVDYKNITQYLEVEKYSRLVYDHGGNSEEERAPLFRVTVLFSESKGKTTMDMTMSFKDTERAKEIGKFIKMAGGNSTWDRLGEYLEKEDSGKEIFVINRTFNAPINTMFEMWSKPEHFSKWLAPTGMNMEIIRSDMKTGGSLFFCMADDAGMNKMYGKINYKEITKPNRLVYTQGFCDENENVTHHPFAPTWPLSMLTNVVLTEESPTQTRVTVTWEVVGDATREEMETFIAERGGMTQGWTGSFDKLEELLAKK